MGTTILGGRNAKARGDDGIRLMRRTRGAMSEIARCLNLADQTVNKWTTVPLEYVFTVAMVLSAPPELLRPDFFINDPLRRQRVIKRSIRRIATASKRVKDRVVALSRPREPTHRSPTLAPQVEEGPTSAVVLEADTSPSCTAQDQQPSL